MQTACLIIAIVSGIAMLFYGFITNPTVRGVYRMGTLGVCFITTVIYLDLGYNHSPTDMKGILLCVFMILILASGGIAKYLDDKREAKENEDE